MRKSYLYYKLALVALTAFFMQSCSKDNGINNTSVIATPYSLYFSDSAGRLINTNDGIFFKPSIFDADGVPTRAIIVADTNLLWVKAGVPVGTVTAHISTNNGTNFNTTLSLLNPAAVDQNIGIFCRDEHRVYIATADGSQNGVKYNDWSGIPNKWVNDDSMAVVPNVRINSFTQLKNNIVIAFDGSQRALFYRTSKNLLWQATSPAAGLELPAGGDYALGHYNNTIVAIDRTGVNGAWYSNNLGGAWYQYPGLPNRKLYVANAPFESVLLVGTDSTGVYALQGNTFVPSNGGLADGTSVRSIIGKENIYVNGVSVQFIYMATSTGIYRSQDLGQNWVQVIPGNYYAVY